MSAHTANEIFARTVRSERKITAQILRMILDFEDNKYHIELGYSSLFEWLTKAHGYDEGSANRRIQAARAMKAAYAGFIISSSQKRIWVEYGPTAGETGGDLKPNVDERMTITPIPLRRRGFFRVTG